MAKAKKVPTTEERDRAKDKRLQSKYGITLAERDARAIEQKQLCKICGGPLDAYGPPNVDHFHFYILVEPALLSCGEGKWVAKAHNECGHVICIRHGKTKESAKAAVKKATMPWSVRALLCFKCNRGLGSIEKFFNAASHPENLLPVIDYLQARVNKALDNKPEIA